MEGEAKENDLRPISDLISGTMRRFLLDLGGMNGAIKSEMYAGCWNFKTLKVSVAILNSIREEMNIL